MAVSQSGIGVVWGISTSSGSGTAGQITLGTGIGRIVSETITNDSKNVEHLNGNGELVGVTFYDNRTQIELEVYPSSTTISNARDAANACPLPGSAVILADAVFTTAIGSGAGTSFLCMASSVRESNSDKTVLSMTLVKAPGMSLTPNPITT